MSADPRRRPAPAQSAPPPPPPPPPPAEAQPDSSVQSLDGASDQNAAQEAKAEESFKLRFCTVCASNNNRYVLLRDAVYCSCLSHRRVLQDVVLVMLCLYLTLCINVYTRRNTKPLLVHLSCLTAVMTLLPSHPSPY